MKQYIYNSSWIGNTRQIEYKNYTGGHMIYNYSGFYLECNNMPDSVPVLRIPDEVRIDVEGNVWMEHCDTFKCKEAGC